MTSIKRIVRKYTVELIVISPTKDNEPLEEISGEDIADSMLDNYGYPPNIDMSAKVLKVEVLGTFEDEREILYYGGSE